jgi:hypothetical protein
MKCSRCHNTVDKLWESVDNTLICSECYDREMVSVTTKGILITVVLVVLAWYSFWS